MTKTHRTLKVWDLPTRIFHWSLALLVVIALLTSVVLATLSGFAVNTNGYSGPLAFVFGRNGLPDDVQVAFANLVIVLVIVLAVVHVGGVLAHGLISRENLPRAMVTGKKHVPDGVAGEDLRPIGIVRPFIALATGVLVAVYFLNL